MRDIAGDHTPAEPGATARQTSAAIALCGVQFVDVLGVTVVVTALPRMLEDLDATSAGGTAVVTAYALFFGGLLMVGSRVGDRLGHRRVVLAGLALFAAASAVGALAESVSVLAIARAAQGMAAAASVPSALRLLTTVVPEGPARRRAVAGWSAAGATAGAAGFVVGGVLTELASWRVVFWMNIGLAMLLAGAVVRLIAPDPAIPGTTRIGWPSAILLTAGAMGIVAGTTLFGEQESVLVAGVLTAVGVLTVGGFALVERRASHPLVAPAARRSPRLRWGAIGSFFNTATTSSSITVATLYLQHELGQTPLRAAALLVSCSILAVVGAIAAPRVISQARLGGCPRLRSGHHRGRQRRTRRLAGGDRCGRGAGLCGFGIGVGSVAANDMGTAVSEAIKGTAAGVLNTSAQLGTAIGTALMLLVATSLQPRTSWIVAAVLAGVAAVCAAATAPRRSSRSRPD